MIIKIKTKSVNMKEERQKQEEVAAIERLIKDKISLNTQTKKDPKKANIEEVRTEVIETLEKIDIAKMKTDL